MMGILAADGAQLSRRVRQVLAIPWEVVWAFAAFERAGLASEPRRGYFISSLGM